MNVKTVFAGLIGCVAIAVQAQTYRLIDLGPGEGLTSLNQKGDVVGYKAAPGGRNQSFRYIYKERRMEITPNATWSRPSGINNLGQIVGAGVRTSRAPIHALLWDGDGVHAIPGLQGGDSYAAAINNPGQVAGWAYFSGAARAHAFLYSNGVTQDLGALGYRESSGNAINRHGHVAGDSYVDDRSRNAFLYRDGVMHDLGRPPHAEDVGVTAVNDADVVVGYVSYAAADSGAAAVFAIGREPRALGRLRPTHNFSMARGINNAGDIVGQSYDPTGAAEAFIYSGGAMKPLTEMLDPATGAGWTLSYASAINNRGQITGYGVAPDGQNHHYLLTPIRSAGAADR